MSSESGSVTNIVRGREGREGHYAYAATPNNLATNFACPAASLPSNPFTCPFLIMCAASIPSIARSEMIGHHQFLKEALHKEVPLIFRYGRILLLLSGAYRWNHLKVVM